MVNMLILSLQILRMFYEKVTNFRDTNWKYVISLFELNQFRRKEKVFQYLREKRKLIIIRMKRY